MTRDLLSGTTLRGRAAEAVADSKLRSVYRAAGDRFRVGYAFGSASVTNWEELRDAARSIRARVLSRLPDVLDRLATAVESAGGNVFFAADAEEATEYVARVARERDAELVVKSKSMASEEIQLNDRLERDGVEVVETDLGEWIIQLAGETPSHIIAPAMHKTRGDVAELFSRVAGGDLSDVPEDLCAFARETLREKFLAADVGVTGVNFAVAETGSICLVTNEGNGRLTTSVPRTHVAIMGMERVVEDWEQLDVLLALLPRAATGQQISTYVTFVTGPRRPGEADGPDDFHLVVLDNGRSQILGTEFQEILHCIRCGACLNVCPVFRQIGGHAYGWVYSGPVGAVLTPLLNEAPEAAELANASSLCAACHEACPVRIPLQDLLLGLRRRNADHAGAAERTVWRTWAATWSRPAAYRASVRLAATAARMLPEALLPDAWTDGRAAPRPRRGASFRARFEAGEI